MSKVATKQNQIDQDELWWGWLEARNKALEECIRMAKLHVRMINLKQRYPHYYK